jgi:hypothetical protein
VSETDRYDLRVVVDYEWPHKIRPRPQSILRSNLVAAVAWRCLYALAATAVIVAVADLFGRAAHAFVDADQASVGAVRIGAGVSLGVVAGAFSGKAVATVRRDLRRVLRRHFR